MGFLSDGSVKLLALVGARKRVRNRLNDRLGSNVEGGAKPVVRMDCPAGQSACAAEDKYQRGLPTDGLWKTPEGPLVSSVLLLMMRLGSVERRRANWPIGVEI